MLLDFKWKRPADIPFPKVWLRFHAKDLNSNELVEYRIEDLTEDRFEDAFSNMKDNFMLDEPQLQSRNAINDDTLLKEYYEILKAISKQRMVLVCLKEGSDEIIAVNWNYVLTKDDNAAEDLKKGSKSRSYIDFTDSMDILHEYGNFNVFDKYGVTTCLQAIGLSVAKQYRRRKIGEKLFEARKYVAQAFDIPITHAYLSSNYSNQLADNVGFKLDVSLSYEELKKRKPNLDFPNIKSREVTLKTWVFPKLPKASL